MLKRTVCLLVAATGLLGSTTPVSGQVPSVIHGRIEDAVSGRPVGGARVVAADSSGAVLTDSLGVFVLPVEGGGPFQIEAEQYGYLLQRFELAPEAVARVSVLRLEPEPVLLEGFDVVSDDAVTELLADLHTRRNFYEGPLQVFDRPRLERFATVGDVWTFVRRRVPFIFECSSALSGLCVRGRVRTLQNPNSGSPVLVCVDGWESWGAVSELQSLDVSGVALVEIYGLGRGGIRVYTAGYLAHAARTGRYIATPLRYGC